MTSLLGLALTVAAALVGGRAALPHGDHEVRPRRVRGVPGSRGRSFIAAQRSGDLMPQYSLPVTVDAQASIGNAAVYVDMLIPRTVTVDNPPDYTWTFIDSNNHWHAYNNKGELPTLDAVQGTGPVVYFCKICRQSIVPATLPGPVDVTVNIRPAWAARVTLNTLPTVGGRVIVRATPAGQPTNFGVASVDSYTGTGPYVVDVIGETAISVMKP